MKKLFTKHISVLRLLTVSGCATALFLLPNTSHAQTYYSQFAEPVNGYNYAVSNPTGCSTNDIQNAERIADGYGTNDQDNTYASFMNNTATAFNCGADVGNWYKFNVNLNLPAAGDSLNAGADVGFKIRVPTGISRDSLAKYIAIGTYLVSADHTTATEQEYRDANSISGRSLDPQADGKTWIIHFTTLKGMNDVELLVSPSIVKLNVDFEFDVYYAYGSVNDNTLPVQIANFKAAVSGKNVNLSWQSLTETNVKGYRIERSSDGGSTYTSLGIVAAKGTGSATINYAFNDNSVVDGKYLYRVVILDRSGAFKNSNAVNAVVSGQGALLVYPTLVRAGQNITVKTAETGNVTVRIFDATGRLVKQQRVTSGGQFSIATTGLTNGVYTVTLVTPGGSTSQSRIVVN